MLRRLFNLALNGTGRVINPPFFFCSWVVQLSSIFGNSSQRTARRRAGIVSRLLRSECRCAVFRSRHRDVSGCRNSGSHSACAGRSTLGADGVQTTIGAGQRRSDGKSVAAIIINTRRIKQPVAELGVYRKSRDHPVLPIQISELVAKSQIIELVEFVLLFFFSQNAIARRRAIDTEAWADVASLAARATHRQHQAY